MNDQYETDFNRWLDSLSPEQREQIARDIDAAHDLIRAEAGDEAVDATKTKEDRWLAAHDAEVRAQALNEAVASLRAKFGPTNRAADYLARAEQTKEDR